MPKIKIGDRVEWQAEETEYDHGHEYNVNVTHQGKVIKIRKGEFLVEEQSGTRTWVYQEVKKIG